MKAGGLILVLVTHTDSKHALYHDNNLTYLRPVQRTVRRRAAYKHVMTTSHDCSFSWPLLPGSSYPWLTLPSVTQPGGYAGASSGHFCSGHLSSAFALSYTSDAGSIC
ncbi:hypothetical protein HDV57DRAFT_331875 [Trichoderma longibrachiatum]